MKAFRSSRLKASVRTLPRVTGEKPRRIRSDGAVTLQRLSAYRAANPDHVSIWISAMSRAKALMPTCDAITKRGDKCRQPRLRGECLCRHHLPDDKMAARDLQDRTDIQTFIIDRQASPSRIKRALNRVVAVETRMLRRLWRAGQWDTPGTTLRLSENDDRVLTRMLLKEDIDISTGAISARSVNELRWAAFQYFRERINEQQYRGTLAKILKQEAAWRSQA